MVPADPELVNDFATTTADGTPENGVYVAPELSVATRFVHPVGTPSDAPDGFCTVVPTPVKTHNTEAPAPGAEKVGYATVPPVELAVGRTNDGGSAWNAAVGAVLG